MSAIYSMINRMAGVGAALYFFPAIFDFETEMRGFLRRHIAIAVPVLIAILVIGSILIHAEQASQKLEFQKRLKGASFRRPGR